MSLLMTEHTTKTARHTTFFLACGREDAPPIIFLHALYDKEAKHEADSDDSGDVSRRRLHKRPSWAAA
jgi:hypothetical protein